jgi:hypothetical protein
MRVAQWTETSCRNGFFMRFADTDRAQEMALEQGPGGGGRFSLGMPNRFALSRKSHFVSYAPEYP